MATAGLTVPSQPWGRRQGSSQGPEQHAQQARCLEARHLGACHPHLGQKQWVRARGCDARTAAQSRPEVVTTSTCSLTKARGRGPHTELRRLHSSRFSPPTQTQRTKQDITREAAGKLDQRLAQGQQTQTSSRSPEQPLPKSVSVQTTPSKKPNYFESLIFPTKQALFCFFVQQPRSLERCPP